MIIPQAEKDKQNQVNGVLSEFFALRDTSNLNARYGKTLLSMIVLASTKLIGCNDRFFLHQDKQYWRHTGTALTYEGLKRIAGYSDYRCCTLDKFEDVVEPRTINMLIQLRKHSAIKNQEGLKTLIQMMARLDRIPVLKVNSKGLIEFGKYLELQRFIDPNEKVNAIEWQVVPDRYNGTYFHLVDTTKIQQKPSWGTREYEYVPLFEFSDGLAIAPFIQISEQPLFKTIIDSLTASIDETKKNIEKGETLIKQFIADYGQFAMFSEM